MIKDQYRFPLTTAMRAATRVGWRDPTSTGYYCQTKHSGKYTYFVRARNQTNKEGLSRIRTRLVLNKRRALRYSTPMASDFSSSESQGRHRRGRRSKSRRDWGTFLRAALRTLPLTIRLGVVAALLVVFGAGVNWAYHAAHKPTEVFFALDEALDKRPFETWREYGPLFRKHATAVITPELLAALAQVEGAGNPVARTYWRWQPSWNPLELYRPASSAVGMFQITDATFEQAKRYCVHNHRVVERGALQDVNACWFNSLYSRILPSHAIELTSALLDRGITESLARHRPVSLRQKQDLAAIIHLCGLGAGQAYVARGLRPAPHQRCGAHDVRGYLDRVNTMKRQFARLAAGESLLRIARPR